jgi:predicted regulator of Ras-like GTPase activity (Roadblock/LC7/MglB family)
MAISDVLQRVGERLDGFKGVVLIGKDALIVEKHGFEDATHDTLAIEFLSLLNKFDGLLDEHGDGPLIETMIRGRAANYLMAGVDDNYFLFLGVGSGENIGRCRFELQKAALDLRRELTK